MGSPPAAIPDPRVQWHPSPTNTIPALRRRYICDFNEMEDTSPSSANPGTSLSRRPQPLWRHSSPRQHQLGAQATDRGGAEREAAAIEARKLDHDRKPQSRARLGLIEAAAAARDLLALLRGEA